MTCLQYLLSRKTHYFPWSIEKPGTLATNSEIRRWLLNKAVLFNGKPAAPDDPLPQPLLSVVLFHKSSKKKNTIL